MDTPLAFVDFEQVISRYTAQQYDDRKETKQCQRRREEHRTTSGLNLRDAAEFDACLQALGPLGVLKCADICGICNWCNRMTWAIHKWELVSLMCELVDLRCNLGIHRVKFPCSLIAASDESERPRK